jgi:fatty-acyl-CoA synthase
MDTANKRSSFLDGQASDPFGSWLQGRAREFGTRAALVGDGSRSATDSLSFEDLWRRSAVLAQGMRTLGLKRGEAIALWLPNRPEWMLIHFAAARLGLLTVPINTWCRESEVSHLMSLGGCRAIFLDSGFRSIDFMQILKSALEVLFSRGELRLDWIIDSSKADASPQASANIAYLQLSQIENSEAHSATFSFPDNSAAIAFSTSGTSSLPKLAVHSAGALVSHAKAVARRAEMTDGDVVLSVLPPCGAYGHGLLMAALSAGARAVLLEEFDLDRCIDAIVAERVSVMAVTEPLLRRLLWHPRARRETFSSLRVIFSAGGTLLPVVERAAELGFRVTNVYGSSEILALAAFWESGRGIAERSAAGGALVSDDMQVRIVDGQGSIVGPGIEGELQFCGSIVTSGYLANPDATRSALSADGWFRSQDLGRIIDVGDRTFHYIARLTDALRIKGFLVSPGEIEAMLQKHPRVAAAQVVGIPDGQGEELAAAFVILHPGAPIEAEELREFSRAKMASYKVPSILQIIKEFPMTRSANGDKVVKHRLRDMAREITR